VHITVLYKSSYDKPVYVANSDSDSVSVIDGKTNAVTNVTVGNHPTRMAVNGETNVIYVLNSGSNSMSVIDGSTNKILAGVAFNSKGHTFN